MEKYQGEIWEQYYKAGSWRDLAEREPYVSAKMNFATLRRYAHGDCVSNQAHRKALGLNYKELVESCPACGEIHDMLRMCKRDRRYRAPRIAIRKDDMDSASRSIINNIAPELVQKLIDNLEIDSRRPER